MRLFKETGAVGILDYVFICSVIVGAALFAASSLKTVLDTETNAKITTVSNELGDITADSSANSYILWMHLSPSEAFLLADSAVDTIGHYYQIASYLNSDLQHFKQTYFSQPTYETQVANRAADIYTNYTNAQSYETAYEAIASPTETDKYDFYHLTNNALDASLVDLQAILNDYNAAANVIMINQYSWASFYDAEYTTKAQNAGTDNDTNTAAFLAAVDSRMDNLNAILLDNPQPGYSTVIGVSDFDNFDFDSENTQKRQYVEQVADDKEAIETMKIDGNGLEDANGNGIEDVVTADIDAYVSAHLSTATNDKDTIDTSINNLVQASASDQNITDVTDADIKAVLNALDLDNNNIADYGSADSLATISQLTNALAGEYSANLGYYDSLDRGVLNLSNLKSHLSTNLLSSLTDAASYTKARQDYKDVADTHLSYFNSDKTIIENYLSNTTIINDKQNAWNDYSTAYNTLGDYNALSVAMHDSYINLLITAAYLTSDDKNQAVSDDADINKAYDDAKTPAAVAAYSYDDINTEKTIIDSLNSTAQNDLSSLITIYNATTLTEFNHWGTEAGTLKTDFDLRVSNAGTNQDGTNTRALVTSFYNNKAYMDQLTLDPAIIISSSVGDVNARTFSVIMKALSYDSLLTGYNDLAQAVTNDMSDIVTADEDAALWNYINSSNAISLASFASSFDSNPNTYLTDQEIVAELNKITGVAYTDKTAITPGTDGLYSSLIKSYSNLQALKTDLNANLFNLLTQNQDEASNTAAYSTASQNYTAKSQLHIAASNADKTAIDNFLATFADTKEGAWNAYIADYTTLGDYNALSDAAFDGYLSGNAYLTDATASTYDSNINTAYNNETTNAAAATDSYSDIDAAKTIINIVNTAALNNLNSLLLIFNNTIVDEFADHNTTGNNHYDNEKLKLTNSGYTQLTSTDLTDLETAKTELTDDFNDGSGAVVASTSTVADVNNRIDEVNEIEVKKNTLVGITLGAAIKADALTDANSYLTAATSNLNNVDQAISNQVDSYANDNNVSRQFTAFELEDYIDDNYGNLYTGLGDSIDGINQDITTINSLNPDKQYSDGNAIAVDYKDLIKDPLAGASYDKQYSDNMASNLLIAIANIAQALADSIGVCHAKIDGSANFGYIAASGDCSQDQTLAGSVINDIINVANDVSKIPASSEAGCDSTKNYIFVANGQDFTGTTDTISGPVDFSYNNNNGKFEYTNAHTISFEASDFTDGQGLCIEWSNP